MEPYSGSRVQAGGEGKEKAWSVSFSLAVVVFFF